MQLIYLNHSFSFHYFPRLHFFEIIFLKKLRLHLVLVYFIVSFHHEHLIIKLNLVLVAIAKLVMIIEVTKMSIIIKFWQQIYDYSQQQTFLLIEIINFNKMVLQSIKIVFKQQIFFHLMVLLRILSLIPILFLLNLMDFIFFLTSLFPII